MRLCRIRRAWSFAALLLAATACATVAPALRDREVANGERYDMHTYTAAHRLYPFGTRLRVTNLDNGRAVTVRVNDRGPFVRGRIIDLSLAAATDLHMLANGTTRVRLERVSIPASVAAVESAYTVQIGAFVDEESARTLKGRLSAGYADVFVSSVRLDGAVYHRVRVGRVATIAEAEELARRLEREGLTSFVTRQDPEPMIR
jgi:rare lipoprotein A